MSLFLVCLVQFVLIKLTWRLGTIDRQGSNGPSIFQPSQSSSSIAEPWILHTINARTKHIVSSAPSCLLSHESFNSPFLSSHHERINEKRFSWGLGTSTSTIRALTNSYKIRHHSIHPTNNPPLVAQLRPCVRRRKIGRLLACMEEPKYGSSFRIMRRWLLFSDSSTCMSTSNNPNLST